MIEEHRGDLQGHFHYYADKSRVSEKEIADEYRADLETLARLEASLQWPVIRCERQPGRKISRARPAVVLARSLRSTAS
jgi:hypothetical protein